MGDFDFNNIDKSKWKKHRFEQIAKSIGERVEPQQTDLEVYVGLEHIDSESVHIKRTGVPSDVEGTKLRVYPGDVIFGKRRAYQRKAAIATFDGICSAHAMVLRAVESVLDPKLFPFFLHSDYFMERAIDISVGSLSPTINWGTLKTQEFLLPPKGQQAKLAELLWAGDEVQQKYSQLLSNLVICFKVKESQTFQTLKFRKGIKNETIGSKLKLINGSAFKPEDWGTSGIPIIRIQNLNGSSDYNCFAGDTRSKVIIENNDLLFAWSGNRGTSFGPYIWQGNRGILNQHIFKIVFSDKEIDKHFLYYYLKYLTAEIESHAHGSAALVHITKGNLEKFPLFLPEIGEQKEISRLLSDISNAHRHAAQVLDFEVRFRKQLINQIFSE